jgi:hypothetical protein
MLFNSYVFYLKLLHCISSQLLWFLYAYKSRRVLPQSYFILSFDCDTEEDIAIAEKVHTRLQDMGITPVYAVPGELLKKGERVYGKLFAKGSEFINHGGRAHTYFDEKHSRHASCFFYDQQSLDILKEDILLGHQNLQDVLGITATGWRTPHFGTFQNPEHLDFLYSVLKDLNYQFSTSTSPQVAYQHGPMFSKDGIVEIPVTGVFSEPFNIMDTWAYFAAPDRYKTPLDYVKTSQNLAAFSRKHPIVINIYGDPSHIHDKEEFFQNVKNCIIKSNKDDYEKPEDSLNILP